MIEQGHKLSIGKQASLLGISRGSAYYQPRPVSNADLALMRRIDELHLDYPFAGSRMLAGLLCQEGHEAGRLHGSTLMKKMGMRVSDLLCNCDLIHASGKGSCDDDLEGNAGRAAEGL